MLFSPQIPLPLEPRRPDRLDQFVPGKNSSALAAVQQLMDEPGGVLFLSGPPGTGKSHLLNAFCHAAREQGLAAFYIALKRLPEQASASLDGLQQLDVVCVDDIDRVAGHTEWEAALFRCFNEIRAARGRLLVASSKPLSALSLDLPDLQSRLAWGVRQTLQVPEDADKLLILQQRAQNLRVEVPDEVLSYLLKHGRRDVHSLLGSLEQLKHIAFTHKRRITVPLAREVLTTGQGEKHAEQA